jgi:hypothetical protein
MTNNRLSKEANELKEIFLSYGLRQIVDKPTYPSNNAKSILDLIFVNNYHYIEKLNIIPNISDKCDHKSLLLTLLLAKNKTKLKMIEKFEFNDHNTDTLNNDLYSVDWFELTRNELDINRVFDKICMKYNSIFSKNILKITKFMKNRKSYNKEIRNLINKRRNLVKFKSKTSVFLEKHRDLTEKIGFKIDCFENHRVNQLIEKSDNFYSLYKSIAYLSKSNDLLSLIDENGVKITANVEIVEKFRSLFDSSFQLNDNSIEPNFIFNSNDRLSNIEISMNDILFALKKFKFNKSEGKTVVKNIVIKKCLNGITKMLFCLFNRILEFKQIPDYLKLSIVSPVPKGNKNKNFFRSYRPVSVQPNIYRIFEIILLNKIMPFIEYNRIIPDSQYGYRKGVRYLIFI